MSPKSPKWQWPALCLVVPDEVVAARQYNCSASQSHVHRVCTCKDNPLQQPIMRLGQQGVLGADGLLNRRAGMPALNATRLRERGTRVVGGAGAGMARGAAGAAGNAGGQANLVQDAQGVRSHAAGAAAGASHTGAIGAGAQGLT